jgi:hypothetical protein
MLRLGPRRSNSCIAVTMFHFGRAVGHRTAADGLLVYHILAVPATWFASGWLIKDQSPRRGSPPQRPHPRLRRSRWSLQQRQPGERTCMHPASLVGSCSCALWLQNGLTYLRQRRMWLHTMAAGRSRPPGPLHGHFCSPCHHSPRWRSTWHTRSNSFPRRTVASLESSAHGREVGPNYQTRH